MKRWNKALVPKQNSEEAKKIVKINKSLRFQVEYLCGKSLYVCTAQDMNKTVPNKCVYILLVWLCKYPRLAKEVRYE